MVECEYCKREMTTADGCTFDGIKINGRWFKRFRVGFPGGMDYDLVQKDERCYDCGAKYGELHHPGCDMEACPRCGEQMISCDCEPTELRIC